MSDQDDRTELFNRITEQNYSTELPNRIVEQNYPIEASRTKTSRRE
jgi:hypothetical protein